MKSIFFLLIVFFTAEIYCQNTDEFQIYNAAFYTIQNSLKTNSYIKEYGVSDTTKIYVSQFLTNNNSIDTFLDSIISLTHNSLTKVEKVDLRNKMLDSIYSFEKNTPLYVWNGIFLPNKNKDHFHSKLKLVFGKYSNGFLTARLFINDNCKDDFIECFTYNSEAFIDYLFIFEDNKIKNFIEYPGTF